MTTRPDCLDGGVCLKTVIAVGAASLTILLLGEILHPGPAGAFLTSKHFVTALLVMAVILVFILPRDSVESRFGPIIDEPTLACEHCGCPVLRRRAEQPGLVYCERCQYYGAPGTRDTA